ncbi:hypothetical protein [Fodinicola feengrottensis]|uniref:hypothetical protein n=1 Tax=Fodinicola feengrottensis TaxID=435914 RepID=UPI0013D7A08E|nr:hypothetical protein [Fodinicola feengrottensis]
MRLDEFLHNLAPGYYWRRRRLRQLLIGSGVLAAAGVVGFGAYALTSSGHPPVSQQPAAQAPISTPATPGPTPSAVPSPTPGALPPDSQTGRTQTVANAPIAAPGGHVGAGQAASPPRSSRPAPPPAKPAPVKPAPPSRPRPGPPTFDPFPPPGSWPGGGGHGPGRHRFGSGGPRHGSHGHGC